ncbi:MAG: ribosome-associated translation inhibitor RaiA [Candidatus Kapabacteria bacterium]|nr:ribosome-associated translation inhibitor RaiA [Candidatus Kapabacteria bacterium]
MKLNVTARHFKARPEVNDAVESAVQNITHFHDGIISTDVILDKHEVDCSVEFIVHISGKTIVAKEHADDFAKAIHGAQDNIIRQIRKHKTKAEKAIHS